MALYARSVTKLTGALHLTQITGDTIFNFLAINDFETNGEVPENPPKIIGTQVYLRDTIRMLGSHAQYLDPSDFTQPI